MTSSARAPALALALLLVALALVPAALGGTCDFRYGPSDVQNKDCGLTCQKYGRGTSRVVGTSGAAYCAISLNGQGLVGVKSATAKTPACEVKGDLYNIFDCCCNA